MFDRPTTRFAEDCVHQDGGPDNCPVDAAPFEANGILFIPAGSVAGATMTRESGAQFFVLMISNGTLGIAQQFTPDGAREFAQSIIKASDAIDAVLAATTAAKLAEIRKGRAE